MIRWLMSRTTLRSWEMNSIDMPNSAWSSFSSATTWAWIETSSALTASSQTMSFGRLIIARAMPTRWFWPPESSCG